MDCLISICNKEHEIGELKELYNQFDFQITNCLKFNFNEGRFYKVTIESDVIGFANVVMEGRRFFDFKRFIHPSYRHKGIGEKLLDYIIDDAKKSGARTLWASFNADNIKAISLFNKKGFKLKGANMIFLKFPEK